jgi:trehalose/maltose transport system substrate-binding protein
MTCPRIARICRLALWVPQYFLTGGRLLTIAGVGIVAMLAVQACKPVPKPAAPVTITLIDQYWSDEESRRLRIEELTQFTNETGIRVALLPAPEAAVEQLVFWRTLLEKHSAVPDVYAVDVIWPVILADHLLDVKPYVSAPEIAEHFPKLIANFTVNERLVALPYYLNTGLLFYRTDLLRKYGYSKPPQTWEELEKAASRIQAGERARGNKNFWGFVWEGAPSESLTCNALEWQVSEGGGNIVENGAVTVNNPQTIRAWTRAARWPGFISPPSVVDYKEWDAFTRWQAGDAAFMRNWANAYVSATAKKAPLKGKFAICPLPSGQAGISGTLGGIGYGVSRYSLHPREAAMLVRFLCSRNQELRRSQNPTMPPTIPELYDNPSVLAANPYFSDVLKVLQKGIALRPSAPTGKNYPNVSHAYFEAVHAVIARKETAETAATGLELDLVHITGFKAFTKPADRMHAQPAIAGVPH